MPFTGFPLFEVNTPQIPQRQWLHQPIYSIPASQNLRRCVFKPNRRRTHTASEVRLKGISHSIRNSPVCPSPRPGRTRENPPSSRQSAVPGRQARSYAGALIQSMSATGTGRDTFDSKNSSSRRYVSCHALRPDQNAKTKVSRRHPTCLAGRPTARSNGSRQMTSARPMHPTRTSRPARLTGGRGSFRCRSPSSIRSDRSAGGGPPAVAAAAVRTAEPQQRKPVP